MHSFIARAAARQIHFTLLALAIACRDSAVSDPPQDGTVGVRAADSAIASLQARGEVHRRNPHDWVGVEHNRMLARFQSELAKPGVLSRNTCDYLLDLAVGWQLANAKDVSLGASWSSVGWAGDHRIVHGGKDIPIEGHIGDAGEQNPAGGVRALPRSDGAHQSRADGR